ncbi:MAG: hypothetical protein LBR10_14780 [Prevotellaceae bacterium]|jgi:hypothetical protein|nr:hypothetical protein [Prevotellaceae bacterium]
MKNSKLKAFLKGMTVTSLTVVLSVSCGGCCNSSDKHRNSANEETAKMESSPPSFGVASRYAEREFYVVVGASSVVATANPARGYPPPFGGKEASVQSEAQCGVTASRDAMHRVSTKVGTESEKRYYE